MVREHYRRYVRLIALCGFAAVPVFAAEGSAERGIAVIADAQKGNCLICHAIPIAGMSAGFGNVGPSLAGVGSRLAAAAIRQRIVDARAAFPDTAMPAYGVSTGLYRVQKAYAGKPILTAQEIDDIVAYLSTLK
jgi:L-cysteine S-thiosulfotransferase